MKAAPLALLLALLAAAPAQAHPDSFADLAPDLIPAVVHISMIRERAPAQQRLPMPEFPEGSPFQEFFEEFFQHRFPHNRQPAPRERSLGSGFILSPEGLIATNDHVIEEADQIEVTLSDGMKLPAEIVGRDPKTDLALLKVEADAALPFVSFGDEADIRVGDWVIAIGNPFGLGSTVTAGIVSGFNRDINSGPYDRFIQTDAAINWGNSGGPLFDLHGQVIGINTKILSPSGGSVGIGFAIPASIAAGVIDQLREYGETRRGWLGVRIQEVSEEIAASLGMDEARGALVSSVTPDSPAAAADIRPGDVILRFAERRVEKMRDLPLIVAETSADRRVGIDLWRNGAPLRLEARIGRLEEEYAALEDAPALAGDAQETDQILGMGLAPMSDMLRERFGIGADVSGIVVEELDFDSEAAEKDVRPGDVIVQVGQKPVATPAEVRTYIRQARREGRSAALFLFNSRGAAYFVALQLEE